MVNNMLHRVSGKIVGTWRYYAGMVHVDLTGRAEDTLLIAGSGRSGTTWLMECLNHGNTFRMMFEPFHPYEVEKLMGMRACIGNKHIEINDEVKREIDWIIKGRIRCHWVDKFNHKLMVKKRMIKAIRIGGYLPWIQQAYPDIKTIYIIRHPFDVAKSKIKLAWATDLEQELLIKGLMLDQYSEFDGIINEVLKKADAFEVFVLMWCMENYYPLKNIDLNKTKVVFYEDFCREPEKMLQEMLQYVGYVPIPEVIADVVKRPSRTTNLKRKDGTKAEARIILDDQRVKALRILECFGMNEFYTEDKVGNIESVRKFNVVK